MSWGDRVAIITGGAAGIGHASARRFARKGAKVVIADIDQAAGKDACEEIVSNGGQAIFVGCDVGERLDIHNLIAATLEAYDRIDVLVNCAGVFGSGDFLSLDESDFDKVMRVNLKGTFLAGQAVARQMIQQIEREGRVTESGRTYSIINMSSVSAVLALPDRVPYTVSKGAVNQLTKAMALSLAEHGIRVNAIGPGAINTHLAGDEPAEGASRETILSRTPLGRIGDPEEVAGVAVFLASPEASYITGQCIYADGGRLALNYVIEKK